jgi:hypothetical protein
MNEKEARDRALLGALHPGLFDDVVEVTDTPDFDAGARADYMSRSDPLRLAMYREPGAGGWYSTELKDGAALLFPWIEDERW